MAPRGAGRAGQAVPAGTQHRDDPLTGIPTHDQHGTQGEEWKQAQRLWLVGHDDQRREQGAGREQRGRRGAPCGFAWRVHREKSTPRPPHVPTAESNQSPKQVNATITVSIQYCERTASRLLR